MAKVYYSSMKKPDHLCPGWPGIPYGDLNRRLFHPPYSSDLASTDYHLFYSMVRHLPGKSFANLADLRQPPTDIFASKTRDFYHHTIALLSAIWQNVLDSDGDYKWYVKIAYISSNKSKTARDSLLTLYMKMLNFEIL